MLIPLRPLLPAACAQVPMVGASGGGLAAVLAACEVAPEDVLESAYALSLEHNIWDRPLGLVGTWGELIQQWLHDLLVSLRGKWGGLCVLVGLPPCCWGSNAHMPPLFLCPHSRPTRLSAATARLASW